MVSYFVSRNVEESVYGFLARYQYETFGSLTSLCLCLFDKESFNVQHLFPTNLGTFVRNTRHICDWDEDYLLENHTIWPYFFAFLNDDEVKRYTEKIYSGNGICGFQSRFQAFNTNKLPKYCPICFKENYQKNGEYFWNRIHQIPDIKICPDHNCFLEEIRAESYWGTSSRIYYPPIIELCPTDNIRFNNSQLIYEIANCQKEILKGTLKPNLDFKSRTNLPNFNNRNLHHISSLKKQFKDYFGQDLLDFYSISDSFISSSTIRGSRRNTSFVALVLLDLFLRKFKIFTSEDRRLSQVKLFGEGPWECLNDKCEFFGKKIISTAKFRYYKKQDRTVAKFTCKCGMAYTKSLVVQDNVVIKVNVFRYLKPRKKLPIRLKRNVDFERRSFWVLNESLDVSRKHYIRKRENSNWLKKYDLPWYNSQRQKLKRIKAERTARVKHEQEIKYLTSLQLALDRIKIENPPFRISRNHILKKAELSSTSRKYPLVEKFFRINSESVKMFWIRRLNYIADQLHAQGLEVNTNNLLKKFSWGRKAKIENDAKKISLNRRYQ
jgi:hypothetical protein